MTQIHVIHVLESFAAGCLTALSTLCHVVQNVQHSVVHATRKETPANFAELFPQGVTFHPLPMQRQVEPLTELRNFVTLYSLLRRQRPHLVHCHSSKAGVLGRWAAGLARIPSVYTPHGYAFLRTDIGPATRACFRFAEWTGARLGNAIVACGQEEYELACGLAPKGRVVCVPSALNLQTLDAQLTHNAPTSTGTATAERPIKVGICGRLAPQRNPELFSRVATVLQHQAEWHWIGADEDDVDCLPAFVQRSGWVERHQALRMTNDLDVYVQTSQWEGLSFAILEAMALRKPVVATDIPANRAIVEHGVTGLLAATPDEMIAHVRTLATDPALRQRMGAAARQRVEEQHDAQKAYRVYGDLYQELLTKQS